MKYKIILLLTLILSCSSCIDLVDIAENGSVQNNHKELKKPRLQKKKGAKDGSKVYVYSMRGLWGVFSTGMDRIASEMAAKHDDVNVGVIGHAQHATLAQKIIDDVEHEQNKEHHIVLVGHSLGANDQIKTAKLLQEHKIDVDLLILVDPTAPSEIPSNVKKTRNYYVNELGMQVIPENKNDNKRVKNIMIESSGNFIANVANHIAIDKNQSIQEEIIDNIERELNQYIDSKAPQRISLLMF